MEKVKNTGQKNTEFGNFYFVFSCVLVACGSSTSWMVKKIIENQGGLYGRVKQQVYLRPFTLRECEQMIESKHGVELVELTKNRNVSTDY